MRISDEQLLIHDIITRFPSAQSAVLPLLWLAQHKHRCITNESINEIAEMLNMHPTEIKEVATFYDMFASQPTGKHMIMICHNISCALNGGDQIIDFLIHKLAINPGETTPDGRFALKAVECLGGCADAPVMLVNDVLYTRLTLKKVEQILNEHK